MGRDASMPSLLEPAPRPWPTPPTHFQTNSFTLAFQEFVNTYGVPRYKEANPALFTAATFPFLFGVMYGDVGHGTCLTLGAIALFAVQASRDADARSRGGAPAVGAKGGDDEMMSGLLTARYMLLMMGMFAIYAGLVYNDCFSVGLALFTSRWSWGDDPEAGAEAVEVAVAGDADGAAVYPFGIDPAWRIASNELLFANSFKMKASVVLGVAQMTLGICLRGANAVYFNEPIDLVCEFAPQMLFNLSLFGYMIILIFTKWTIDWDARMLLATCADDAADCDPDDSVAAKCPLNYGGTGDGCQPPNLISQLMDMALKPGYVDEPMYRGQAAVQLQLLLVAFVCVPWLLLAKPLWLRARPRATHAHGADAHGDFDFSEVIIHQAIETIEFVLGMVSNTASYLRLWALSLAHGELAAVFWEKCVVMALATNSAVAIVIGYAIFAAVTFGVLLAMDVLECFLHALRLHWVEFQNKFYKADGRKFMPLSYANLAQ